MGTSNPSISEFGQEVHNQSQGASMKGLKYNEETGIWELVDDGGNQNENSLSQISGMTWAILI